MEIFLTIFLATWCLSGVLGLPGGAPSGACSTFTPRHVDRMDGGFISFQNASSSPYSIRMSRSNFTSNAVIRVWIEDSRSGDQSGYRGILLQARKRGNFNAGPVGTWQNAPRSTRMLQCNEPKDAMTHSEVTTIKNAMTVFEWKAPCKKSVGDIVFTATIAQSREMFWPRISSMAVLDMNEDEGSGDEEDECNDSLRIRPVFYILLVQAAVVYGMTFFIQ